MSTEGIKVCCSRKECSFYEGIAGDAEYAICHHNDKAHYLNAQPCPLFRLDFKKAASSSGAPKDFLKMVRRR